MNPIVVHYWADLQSVNGLRCYGNITRTRNVSEYMFVLAVCLSAAFYVMHNHTPVVVDLLLYLVA